MIRKIIAFVLLLAPVGIFAQSPDFDALGAIKSRYVGDFNFHGIDRKCAALDIVFRIMVKKSKVGLTSISKIRRVTAVGEETNRFIQTLALTYKTKHVRTDIGGGYSIKTSLNLPDEGSFVLLGRLAVKYKKWEIYTELFGMEEVEINGVFLFNASKIVAVGIEGETGIGLGPTIQIKPHKNIKFFASCMTRGKNTEFSGQDWSLATSAGIRFFIL